MTQCVSETVLFGCRRSLAARYASERQLAGHRDRRAGRRVLKALHRRESTPLEARKELGIEHRADVLRHHRQRFVERERARGMADRSSARRRRRRCRRCGRSSAMSRRRGGPDIRGRPNARDVRERAAECPTGTRCRRAGRCPAAAWRLHHPRALRRSSGPGLFKISEGTTILPTSCSSAPMRNQNIVISSKPMSRASAHE